MIFQKIIQGVSKFRSIVEVWTNDGAFLNQNQVLNKSIHDPKSECSTYYTTQLVLTAPGINPNTKRSVKKLFRAPERTVAPKNQILVFQHFLFNKGRFSYRFLYTRVGRNMSPEKKLRQY